jgi:exosortase
MIAIFLGAAMLPRRLLLTPFPVWPQLLLLFSLVWAGAVVAGSWMLAGKAGARWIAGPLILLVTTLPVPGVLESSIILPLRAAMASLAADISNLLGHPALASGTSIQLAQSWVGIDEACGGIRSLQACIMIGLFFGEWYRFSWAKRVVLLGAAVLSAVSGNFGRVLFLALRATGGAQSVEAAHDAAGWLAMGASVALTGFLAWRWAGYRSPAQRSIARTPVTNSAGWQWLAAVAALFLAGELATRGWYAHGEAKLPKVARWSVQLPTTLPTFRAESLPGYAREVLRPDLYVAGAWKAPSYGSASAYYIEWRQGQAARSAPFDNNPTICLPLSGCELLETLPPLVVPWAGGELPFRAFKFRRAGQDSLVAFIIWDPARGRPVTQEQVAHSWREWWALQWIEVREARQNQPAQLLTVAIPWSENAGADAGNLLSEIIASGDERYFSK